MVALSIVHSSNSRIASAFPEELVAIFVGGTSGIGESALKKFARYSRRSRAYIIGRSQESADRIISECQSLDPSGSYSFIKADVSLIRVVDEVCKEIKQKEKTINILFFSQGVRDFDRSKTSEGLHLLASLNYYSRIRFITNLLPLLRTAPLLRRVVSVAGGTLEGPLDFSDFPALEVPVPALRGHLSSLITLGMEAVAKSAPEVSFVHDYPGAVRTPLMEGMLKAISEEQAKALVFVPIEESGERHVFLATSAMFSPCEGESGGVGLVEGEEVAVGTNGQRGSGFYSVDLNCECASPETRAFLAEMRQQGRVEDVWKHTMGEFKRITELAQ